MHETIPSQSLSRPHNRFVFKQYPYLTQGRKAIVAAMMLSLLTLDIPMMHNTQAADVDPSAWVTVPISPDPIMQGLAIPADAPTRGMWSSVKSWPLNSIHAAVLPDGKVLTYGTSLDGAGQDGRYFDLWDPTVGFGNNSHQTTFRAQQQDSFCSNSTYLTDGRLIISGGNGGRTTTIYTPSTNTVQTASYNLALDRWYATLLNLPDGRPIILGGMVPYSEDMENSPDQAVAQGLASMTPEILETTGWRSLFGAYSREAFGPDYLRASFPRAFIAPNGQIFGVSSEKMWYLDPNGNGTIRIAGNFKVPYTFANPVNVGATNTAVMYAPGKILIAGGNGSFVGDDLPASNKATVIDINGANPVLTEQPAMTYVRRFLNSIVLSNGKVVITGGSARANNDGSSAVYGVEIWDPTTGTWSQGANAAIYRGYHSNTVLMPNGTILSFGGGAPGPINNLNAEVYYPPYLFRTGMSGAQLAPRPVIQAISGLSYDHEAPIQMDMTTTENITQLVLLGVSKGTHAFNTGQRRIPLTFSQQSNRLTATIPNANLTPPGYYQVVTVNANGVPSLGVIIAIGQNVAPPNVPTTPYDPPEIGGTIDAPVIGAGGTANYSVTAVSSTTYSWNFGDGSPDTPYNANPAVSHSYAQPGVYVVTLSAKDTVGAISRRTFLQAVATVKTAKNPTNSSPITVENRSGNPSRIWVVNPDNDSVSVLDGVSNALVTSIDVGTSPRTVAVAPDGRIWVTNKRSASISVISPTTLAVVQTLMLPRASLPHGLTFDSNGTSAFVALEATGQLLKLNATTGAQQGIVDVAPSVRHVAINADASLVLVSRFISPPALGEATATIDTTNAGGEVIVVNANTMVVTSTVKLAHSDKTDTEIQGRGLPNYLAAPAISPDGTQAWLPSKQDNIKRGLLRSGQQLDFQNTVRAISSSINMATLTENYAKRIDHDNSSVGSAAVYHPSGVYAFIALETSRQVAVIDAIGGRELFRLEVGRAPQGLALSEDGNTLYVQEFMDRSVTVFDLSPLLNQGKLTVSRSAITYTIETENLDPSIVLGKQLFYDARDTRLARDNYMSCASCHNDGGQDGRVWDLTGFGEGLRNTIALNGRAGKAHGFLHWSANFDEVQDFERQIRELSGGSGLMADADYATGTRNQPLGDRKSGISTSLDELAAYVESLNKFDSTPYRDNAGGLTPAATAGKAVFQNNCISCHGSFDFTISNGANGLRNIGTIKPSSGNRLNATLSGIDIPTLRDVWATAPYLHDGSAATMNAAITAHNGITLSATDMTNVVSYVQQIGMEEAGEAPKPSTGTGLNGAYYYSNDLSGNVVLQRIEDVNFNWGNGSPAATLPADNFSARWTGYIEATVTGSYQLQTNSDDGVRVYLNNQLIIDNWSGHPPTLDASAAFNMNAGQRLPIIIEYQELTGGALLGLNWKLPGASTFSVVPKAQLYSTIGTATQSPPTVTLTAPTAGMSVGQGAAITVSANATDSDGTVTQVAFYDDATLIATDTTAPYSISWTNAAVGSHSITARATDNSGAVTASTAVTITVTSSTPTTPGTGTGLNAAYYSTSDLTGTVKLQRVEDINFDWGNGSPGAGVPVDNFSVRWTGFIEATVTGSYQFQTYSDDGLRVYVNNQLIINNWTPHGPTLDTSATLNMTAGQRIPITVEFQEFTGGALMELFWKVPGTATYNVVPKVQLYTSSTGGNVAPTVSLTAPSAGASVVQGTAITVSANAADSDGTITQVAFYDGATLIATDTTSPYSISWTNAAVGSHSITARATDNGGTVTTSAAVAITVTSSTPTTPGTGTGLNADYYATNDLTGSIVLQRVEDINFDWGNASPGAGLPADNFSVRWTGFIEATVTGSYQFQSYSDDGLRVYINNQLVINNWTPHGPTLDTSAAISMTAGQRIPITVEFQEFTGGALMELFWKVPGATTYDVVPKVQLYNSSTVNNNAPTVALTAPASGANIIQGTAITVSANAADSDGTITQVAFYDGATLIATDTTSPYSISWTNAAVGTHSVTARATDNSGAVSISSVASVTVTSNGTTSTGTGLNGSYYNSIDLSGNAVLQRVEDVNFNWGTASPGAGVPANNFTARWTGYVEALAAGNYQFQTNSDDGVRVYLNNQLIINNWASHGPTLDTSAVISMTAGQRLPITVEFLEFTGGAVMQLLWKAPGASTYSAVPKLQLYISP
ncbi:cytochrome c peroxidase [Methylophilaceae bacterium 11]|nr:cytochrome c peroxidase [Methylophilaceae bacterium 11]